MASAQVTITQLPDAGPLTGNEAVPIVQNGQTVQTTTGAIAVQPTQTQTFLTATQQTSLPNSRYMAAGSGLSLTDGGAQGTLQINMTGSAASLNSVGNGLLAKTATDTITPREIQTGTGLSVSNGDGIAGNPVVGLGSFLTSVQSLSGSTGLVGVSGGTATPRSIAGTSDQITVTNGDGSSGDPTVGLATNPVLPGNGGAQFPAGTTAQRPLGVTNGTFRYNTDTSTFEGFANNVWGAISLGSGVTSVATGTGLTGGPITSTGTISIANTGVSAATYGSSTQIPVIAVNAQGQITSATSTSIVGTLSYQGGWNASTNSPTLTSSVGTTGYYYVVTTAGTTNLNGITDWQIGDWAIFNGSVWQKIDQTNTVSSVNGQTGAVSIGYADLAGAIPTWAIANGGTGQTTASAAFNALSPITTAGDLIIGNGTNSATRLGIGANGYILTSNGTTATWSAAPASGVTTFSAGTTGFTPSTDTSGAVTLAGTLAATNGGTGQSSYAVGDLLYASTTTAVSKLADVATGNALISGGVGVAPSYGKIGLTTHVSGTLPTANGGTNLTSFTSGGALYATSTSALTTGTLPVASGGTGLTSVTANYIPYGNGTSAFNISSQFQYNGTYLLVGAASALGGLTNPVAAFTGNPGTTNYIQTYCYNAQNGISSSADFVAYASNSTDAHGWADMGFTSPSYADLVYTVTGPNEGYFFASALNSTYTGNAVYATDSTGSQNYHQWYVGGFTQLKSAWKMQLTSTGLTTANSVTALGGISGGTF